MSSCRSGSRRPTRGRSRARWRPPPRGWRSGGRSASPGSRCGSRCSTTSRRPITPEVQVPVTAATAAVAPAVPGGVRVGAVGPHVAVGLVAPQTGDLLIGVPPAQVHAAGTAGLVALDPALAVADLDERHAAVPAGVVRLVRPPPGGAPEMRGRAAASRCEGPGRRPEERDEPDISPVRHRVDRRRLRRRGTARALRPHPCTRPASSRRAALRRRPAVRGPRRRRACRPR